MKMGQTKAPFLSLTEIFPLSSNPESDLITQNNVARSIAHAAMTNPQELSQYVPVTQFPFSVLVDANMDYTNVLTILEEFGVPTYVNLLDKQRDGIHQTDKDRAVYRFARDNEFDIILTKDVMAGHKQDFACVACNKHQNSPRIRKPLIVAFSQKNGIIPPDKLNQRLRNNADLIREAHENAEPFLAISSNGHSQNPQFKRQLRREHIAHNGIKRCNKTCQPSWLAPA